jgi:hypothetical protein
MRIRIRVMTPQRPKNPEKGISPKTLFRNQTSKFRRYFFPWISGLRHPVTEIEQFAHVFRIERLLGFKVEVVRNVGQVKIDAFFP